MSKWRTLVAVSIATFMLLLDVTVVNVALPDIQTELGADFNELRWVIDAYALTLAATILIFGSLADRYGRRLLFTIGLTLFSVTSLACGLAWSPVALDVLRGAQGFGGAAMLATSLALIAGAYTNRDRNTALAVWGASTAAAVAIGPLVGGALVDAFEWEAIFFVNVPIGLITAALVARGVPETRDPSAHGRPDFAGLLAAAGSMSMLVLALFRGNDEGWGSGLILGLFAGAAVLLAAFVLIEWRARRPLLDLDVFRKPSTAGASLGILMTAISVFAMLTFLVLYIQNALGYSALGTGLRLFPLTVMSFFAAAISGRLADRVPVRFLLAAGLVMAGVGSLLNRGLGPDSDWTALLAGGILVGAGAGTVNPAVAAAALGTVARAKSGMASGLNSTFRLLGVAVGVAALGAILESRVTEKLGELLPRAPRGLSDIVATGNVEAAANAAPPQFREQTASAAKVAFVSGMNEIFLVAALVAFAGAVLSLVLVRSRDFVAQEEAGAPAPEPEPEAVAA
jgi:EmrB/QacA subfamily drug resistance transporter